MIASGREANEILNWHNCSLIPNPEIPTFRTSYAIQQGVEKNLLLITWGGLGDQICSEPTLRYALKTFKDCDISLASECPQLFTHLKFKRVFDLNSERPIIENYLPFEMIRNTDSLTWEFMSHMLINCVDYPALCAFRCQLPVADREITLVPSDDDKAAVSHALIDYSYLDTKKIVVIHPGRHWQSKTFPKHWWDGVIKALWDDGIKPIIIGANMDDNRGTVDVDTTFAYDLRNKLTIMQTVALLQKSAVLLTNDSAPLHMAASGNAWIGFFATCKHPDMISHWRQGKWSHKMENLSVGGIWDLLHYCPNKPEKVEAENVGDNLEKWLPEPASVASWAIERIHP